MAWVFYDAYVENLYTGEHTAFIDHEGDTFKIAFVKDTYTPDRAVDVYFDDSGANDPVDEEVTGTGYTQGGNEVANPDVTVAGNVITFDADDPATWSQDGAGFADARFAILYKDSGVDTTANLVAYHDLGSDKGNVAGDLSIQLDATGISTTATA
jgi:hypothetical protein